MKYKMFTIYDFHIDFHFWVHLTTLRGLQMVWYPRITEPGPGRPRVWKFEIFFNCGQDFEHRQLLEYAEMNIFKKWAKNNHANQEEGVVFNGGEKLHTNLMDGP